MRKSVIIVAGGSGTRMGADTPKQFLELAGKPILMHTLVAFNEYDPGMQLVLVLPAEQMKLWSNLCKKHDFQTDHVLTAGGETRFLSVRNGLQMVEDADLIGIHDGVRPFVSARLIASCFKKASESGAAIPVVPVVQSLRKVDGRLNKAVDRTDYRQVQTPQCFRKQLLVGAFEGAQRTDYSDDATVVEAAGHTVTLVDGEPENVKITTPTDLALASVLVARPT